MKNSAFIYRRPSKWPIATALAAAVLIHLSAVAIAFRQESPPTAPAAIDPTTIGVYFADNPPIPPDPDISVLPPGPVPAADFIEPQETRRVIKAQRTPAPTRPSRETRLAAVGNGKAFVLSAPRPDYPYEARSRMEQSIGNPILDNSTVSAFRRWRFKPGTPARVRIPITFVLTGAQY
ncbi:MAG: hypothetical protein DME43_15095 [Verrucomicrobia bacterium]|nr:MAG: hypothetical protein DME43_15095 [Verrucomicrobiota bacterium]